MSKRKRNWCKQLDAAIKNHFNFEVETVLDIFSMQHATVPADRKTPLTNDMHLFIAGYMAAISERQ